MSEPEFEDNDQSRECFALANRVRLWREQNLIAWDEWLAAAKARGTDHRGRLFPAHGYVGPSPSAPTAR